MIRIVAKSRPGSGCMRADRPGGSAGIKCIVCPDHFIPKSATAFDQADLVVGSLHELSAQTLYTVHESQ